MKKICIAASMVLGMACSMVAAEVKLASAFSDHMVLQRDKAVRIWGTAAAGETVTVKVDGASVTAITDDQGRWQAELPKHAASETPVELTASEQGGNEVKITDVLFGDVWICSGQSNMEFGLPRANNASTAIPAATDTQIRLLVVPHNVSETPQSQQTGTWAVCSPETAARFSAVGYFFGKEIRAREHVPVGLIGTYWGGTPAESWTPKTHLRDEKWSSFWEQDRQALADFPKAHAAWEERIKTIKGKKPAEPMGPKNPRRPTVLWNGMVQPLIPMTVTGVIWYQGEGNAARAEQYRTLFPNMIQAWRDEFKQPEVPFLFVQLANFRSKLDTAAGSPWAELREAQAMTLKLPNTGMAVAIDVGNPSDIHPTDKLTVGTRLALAAEAVAYGKKDVVYQGPTYQSMKVTEGKVHVKLSHADGLTAKGDTIEGFTLAGEDQKFVPAEATIEGDTVIVSSPDVTSPVVVRYGWSENPRVNLYNGAGLPAVPFRSDDWPLATAGKK